MPGHGTKKRKSCGSRGGTRKQRGGFGFLNKLAKNAKKNFAAAKSAIKEHPVGKTLSQSAAKHITAAKAAAGALAAHPHVQSLSQSARDKIDAGVAGLTVHMDTLKKHPITKDLKKKVGQHLNTLQEHVEAAHSTVKSKMGMGMQAKMGGRKKRGHKKRHATKKHGHKKRHATKKRGHKKRKQRGGKCGCEML